MKKGFRILKFKKTSPILEIKNLSKSFDGRPTQKLSLKVYPGEIVGLLGLMELVKVLYLILLLVQKMQTAVKFL